MGVTTAGEWVRRPETRAGQDGDADPQAPPLSDDQALWEQAARGDRSAFGELYRRHAEAVWNFERVQQVPDEIIEAIAV